MFSAGGLQLLLRRGTAHAAATPHHVWPAVSMAAWGLQGRGFASGARKRTAGSNRAAKGLYGGRDVGFGNKVSHSERKTRRMWKPNVQKKRLWSEALGDFVRFSVTTHVLRCIDKAGGLDNYILGTPPHILNSTTGEAARSRILEALEKKGEGGQSVDE